MLTYDQLIEDMYEPTLYMDEDWEIYILETVANRYAEFERVEREKNNKSVNEDEKDGNENENDKKTGNKDDKDNLKVEK